MNLHKNSSSNLKVIYGNGTKLEDSTLGLFNVTTNATDQSIQLISEKPPKCVLQINLNNFSCVNSELDPFTAVPVECDVDEDDQCYVLRRLANTTQGYIFLPPNFYLNNDGTENTHGTEKLKDETKFVFKKELQLTIERHAAASRLEASFDKIHD